MSRAMLHTVFRTATAVTFIVLAALLAATDARADEPRVIVRMYDTATTDADTRAIAMRTAAAIVEDAGLTVDWRDCSRGGEHNPCRTLRGARELVVRIMPAYVAKPKAPRAALSTREASGDADLQLGFAAVDPDTRTGVMATMYHDRVETVARRAGIEYGQLLGRAIAHELGHLLLHVTGHSQTGLMRAMWTDTELAQNRPEDWLFAPTERRQMQAASLAARSLDRTQALAIPAGAPSLR